MSKTASISIDELSPYVRKAGRENIKNWVSTRRIYDHKMMYCIKGSANVIIDNNDYILGPDTLILIKPDHPHRIVMDYTVHTDILLVHFDFTFRRDVYNLQELVTTQRNVLYQEKLPWDEFIRHEVVLNNGFEFPVLFKPDNTSDVEYLFTSIIHLYEQQTLTWQLDAKIMLLGIIKIIYEQELLKTRLSIPNQMKVSSQIKQYIERNYYRKICLDQLANLVGLSLDYTGKIFKKETGINISTYLNHVRLSNAKKLLLNQTLSLANIAEMVGFNDAFYFSKVMKKIEKVSPSEWRKNT